ncbi:hypothetical protein N7510_001696 [Penicillium lagena]|uniref:uncharacterized protein n=1 Tax=Penicillium lagena TaxID=94218 RepID=UPI002541C5F3|nr:uncharacterized protein N7510_001696 [Penicillium lagena]KAJ5625387.1 hypothetical protein N7510_001696 [Penicillium lagena]
MPPAAPEDDPSARRKRSGRKYTSRACEECRRRRAKCDGVRPSCTRCLDRGVRCQYSTAEDGRQPAPKSYVVMLRNRIEMLERVLDAHGIDADASVAQMMADMDVPDPLVDPNGCSKLDDLCVTFDGALTLDESLNFDQDGEVRYFGPTSGRLLFLSDPEKEHIEQTDASGATCSESVGCRHFVNIDHGVVSIPDELQSHLLDLFFEWEQPWFPVINEKLFRESLACGGRYCSSLLLNCVLALGSRYSDRLEVRTDPNDSNTAGKMFIEEAERLIQHDLRWPSITTIQSLTIMNMMYVAMGSDAAGWLHQGMAIRLALDMGFNMDPAVLAGTVSLPPIEIELRRQIYWALYCHDKLAASYTGRVCTLLDSQGVVNKPSIECAGDIRLPSSIDGKSRAASQRDVTQLQRAMIDLCHILERILLSLWSPKPLLHPHQRAAFFESCILDLKTWYYDLAPELKIDRPSGQSQFPHAYTLCMVYHTVYILLCGPFLSKHPHVTEKNQNPSPLPPSKTKPPRTSSLAKQAQSKYRQVFGSFRLSPITPTHSILSAALTIIDSGCSASPSLPGTGTGDSSSSCSSPGPSRTTALALCLQVLRELSTSWNIAKRIGRNLEKLYCQKLNCAAEPGLAALTEGHGAGSRDPGQDGVAGLSPNTDPPEADRSMDLGSMSTQPASLLLNDPYINSFTIPAYDGLVTGNNDYNTDLPNSGDRFANNLGFAFSPDCLPSDYNIFDTLNQMYLEEMW